MVSEQEWARMCEPYLAGDSGVALNIEGVKNEAAEDRRAVDSAITSLCANYSLALEWANDLANTVEDRFRAYRVANTIVEHLSYVGVNPLSERH